MRQHHRSIGNTRISFAALVMLAFAGTLLISCSRNKNVSAEEMLAGRQQKTWKAKTQIQAGDVASAAREETKASRRRQRMTFWRNGNMQLGMGDEVFSGQWTLAGNTLRLQVAGSDTPEEFTIVRLEKDQLVLKAGDGPELVMKPGFYESPR